MFDGVDGTKCPHDAELVPQEGDDGLWCPLCGLKIMAVEKMPCGECVHCSNKKKYSFICLWHGGHIYANAKRFHVLYMIKDGRCWGEKPDIVKKSILKAGIAGMKKIGKMLDDKK